jgi:hypothetical protein
VKTVVIDGLVADASADGTLILNVGSSVGVKIGDKLAVKRVGRKITDPATGKVIRQIEDPVGQVTITEVDAKSSVGKFSGAGKPQVRRRSEEPVAAKHYGNRCSSTAGDYQVIGILGAGGMGKVFKVRNVISDRQEAMKVLLPDLATAPDLANRFLREIKVTASLDHPNIAALRTAVRVDNHS